MKPDFSRASQSFKDANPNLFEPVVGSEQDLKLVQPPEEAGPSKAELKSEKELQEQIVGFLERNNTVVIRSRMDRKTSTNVGTPDLLFAIRGRAVAYEVKLPGKKLTEEQRKMMNRMTWNGWACFIIDSYNQAVEIFRKLSS